MNFYFDANLPWVFATSLNEFERPLYEHQVFSTAHEFGQDLPDEELIPQIASELGVLLTKDLQIKKTIQFELIKEYQIGAIFISPPKNSHFWIQQKLIFSNWFEIRNAFKNKNLPLCYNLNGRGNLTRIT